VRKIVQKSFHFDFVVLTLSYNQPRFCLNTIWNSKATTFANESFLGTTPHGIFVNSNNSIYILNRLTDQILIWQNENHLNPTKSISDSLSFTDSIFVTTNGDIYVDNGQYNGRVDKWIVENETWISVMNVTSYGYGLFIDIYDNLYCSVFENHQVDKKWLNGTTTIVAGIGFEGSESDMLYGPMGIFVDINLDLYVADCYNDRIQLFRSNQRNGITVAGNGSTRLTIELYFPSGIVLDGDQHLFIVDFGNHRIIVSDQNGFRCIFGCSGEEGSTNDKLSYPTSMSFDSYGNIYVADGDNHRIQKIVKNNICGKKFYLITFKGKNRVYLLLYSIEIREFVQTNYSSNLSVNSHQCHRRDYCRLLNYYCEIIKIHTKEEGDYTIISHSTKNLFGYIYENNFTLFDLNINKIESNNNGYYNSQFKITLYRPANSSFLLIVTTAQELEQGHFSITVHGPSYVSMQHHSKFTEPIIQSNYSSELNNKSQKHTSFNCRPLDHYYEALEVNVNTSGFYIFSTESSLNIIGYLYEHQFNPYDSIDNSLARSDDPCDDKQLRIIAYLKFNITYILIITTHYAYANQKGPFSLFVKGPDVVKIKQMSMYTNIHFNFIL